MANLILYSKSKGIGQILRPRLPSGDLEMIRSESDWRTSWDKIVWIDSQFDGHQANGHLLFYDSGAGIGELYRYRPHADEMIFAARHTDWRTGWNEVVSARLGNLREDSNLVFYQRAGGGEGEVYTFSTEGRMNLVIRDKAWRDSWAKVVAGRFTLRSDIRSAGYDLLFYDQSHGDGELWGLDPLDGLHPWTLHKKWRKWGWRSTWSQIVPIWRASEVNPLHALLFYDADAGDGELYGIGSGPDFEFRMLKRYSGWRNSWDKIISVGANHILFYSKGDGDGELYSLDYATHELSLIRRYRWPHEWDEVLYTGAITPFTGST